MVGVMSFFNWNGFHKKVDLSTRFWWHNVTSRPYRFSTHIVGTFTGHFEQSLNLLRITTLISFDMSKHFRMHLNK